MADKSMTEAKAPELKEAEVKEVAEALAENPAIPHVGLSEGGGGCYRMIDGVRTRVED
jgi:hypothetical protein